MGVTLLVMRKKRSKLYSKNKQRYSNSVKKDVTVILEYYSRPFEFLSEAVVNYGYDVQRPHEIRKRFWGLLLPGIYDSFGIRPLLKQYNKSIERELASIISKHSLAYWLHLYRRIGPYPAGRDDGPLTIGLVRAVLEKAFHKYAKFAPCDSIGISKETPIEKILSGLLLSKEFELEREGLKEAPKQMVLTNFSALDMLEIYNAEKLAYEMWRSTATLRIVGKGTTVTVSEIEPYFYDNRSDELNKLVEIFDDRHHGEISSSLAGVSFANLSTQDPNGAIILPTYNMGHITSEGFHELFKRLFRISLETPVIFNFIWAPFDIKGYRISHLLFSNKFAEIHKVDLDSVLLVIAALCNRVLLNMAQGSLNVLYKYYQRAYEGPYKKEEVIKEVLEYIPLAANILDIPEENLSNEKILRAMQFLELSSARQSAIDLEYPGPHVIFLPYGDDRWFIDYAWINSLLYNLFIGVAPDNQKLKGDILEKIVNFKKSILPTKPCKSLSKEFKQIDASFEVGNRLIIVECKAINKSVAFDKGDSTAIQFRVEKFIRALNEVDEKANWLALNPQGANYDIRKYDEILPLVVSPFIEYIPSLSRFFWVDSNTPRVVAPIELKRFLEDGKLSEQLFNVVKISESDKR